MTKLKLGDGRRRLEKFKLAHSKCCFCGGQTATESRDHLQPKIIFIGSRIPANINFEFPACASCNSRSKQFDQAAAMVALTSPRDMRSEEREHFDKIVKGVSNNASSIVQEILDGFVGQRSRAKEFERATGVRAYATSIGPQTLQTLRILTAKLGFAYFYRETGEIVPSTGAVISGVVTNSEIIEHGFPKDYNWDMPFTDLSAGISAKRQILYRYLLLEDRSAGIFQFGFHENILCVATVVTRRDNHPVFEDSMMTFLPGFMQRIEPPPKRFRTGTTFTIEAEKTRISAFD